MKPTFAAAATAIEPVVHPYDHCYVNSSSSSAHRDRSSDHNHSYSHIQHSHQLASPASSSSSSSMRFPSSSSSLLPSPSSSSPSYPRHHRSDEDQYHQQHQQQQRERSNIYHHHQSHSSLQDSRGHHPQEYSSHNGSQAAYPSHDVYTSYAANAQRAYEQYTQSYSASAQHVKHTEGYEGRVRNTTRDHNDHLVADSSVRDQQHYRDQFHRDSTYGYIKRQQAPSLLMDGDIPSYKYQLPPIHVPEEPFYRSDLPGRHMRYFSNVTSQDRDNSDGFISSARHVAPSNTTGNFGHGPPINQTLEKFETARQRRLQQQRQQQQQLQREQQEQQQEQQEPKQRDHCDQQQPQQEQGLRLPSLYTALPEQRPTNMSPTTSQQSKQRHEQRHTQQQQQQQQHELSSTRNSNGKALQPSSIAPAPGPLSPVHLLPAISPTDLSLQKTSGLYDSRRHVVVKVESSEPSYRSQYEQRHHLLPYQHHHNRHQQQHHPHPVQAHQHESHADGKRKWTGDHSPIRPGPCLKDLIDSEELPQQKLSDESASQEPHLLSRRSTLPSSHKIQVLLPKAFAAKHPLMRMQRYQMTTIRCWHGAIAQKSYGIEKRYLCPPPVVQVSAGANAKRICLEQPHVIMSILHDKLPSKHQTGSENLMEQDCTLDDHLKCSFRNLHVTGTGTDSSKQFKLGLKVFLNKTSAMPTAIMDSNPIPIISKPSKKTAKAGNASCFILNGMSVSLLNRINAQTVRTKYMAVDNNAVCAKIGSWSSFTIKMIKPPPAPPVKIAAAGNVNVFRSTTQPTKFVPIRMKGDNSQSAPLIRPLDASSSSSSQGQTYIAGPQYHTRPEPHHQNSQQQSLLPHISAYQSHSRPQKQQQEQQREPTFVFSNSEPVLYGSEIILINDLTGVTTDRLIIRKVENGKVICNGTGPVSQMQKIVLQHPDRVHPEDGRPYYLSAPSIGSPKIEGKIPLQAAMERSPLLEYRTSSKKSSIMELTEALEKDGEECCEDDAVYQNKRGETSIRVPKGQENVTVDDFVCWTIAGIAKFDYTYFDPISASIDTDVDPRTIPRVLTQPRYNAQSNSLVMKVKNVFEQLTAVEEQARLCVAQRDDLHERKLSLSELMYKRCEDDRQPIEDEDGPIQLWLAQHGPVRMRRRFVKELLLDETKAGAEAGPAGAQPTEDSDSETESAENTKAQQKEQTHLEDNLPKIPTKSNAIYVRQQRQLSQSVSSSNTNSARPTKLLSRPMGLEAELPFGCEIRAVHDGEGNATAEMDLLMVERVTGIAYPTGYKITYSRARDSLEWVIEVKNL
ncbi:hypothetical protein BGZ98_003665 [Dissophora globulifera]|nr:hypothetical protein BGZ98_003665 [Dissophora globulifera]